MTPVIDLVYTFVDGNDPNHISLRHKYRPPSNSKDEAQRHRSHGEVYSSIRSALAFAPWLRRIWVVIDDIQVKKFNWSRLPSKRKVKLVKHSSIFLGECKSHLPTFNSHSLEAHLGHIPGLAKLFIYANDDMLFGSPVRWQDFFSDNLRPKVQFSLERLPSQHRNSQPPWYNARVNNTRLLDKLSNRSLERKALSHQMRPMSKTLFKEAWNHPSIRKELLKTSSRKFRDDKDVEPLGLMVHWGWQRGVLQKMEGVKNKYIGIRDHTGFEWILDLVRRRKYKLICINDKLGQKIEGQLRYERFLKTDFVRALKSNTNEALRKRLLEMRRKVVELVSKRVGLPSIH